ncbi:Sec-independent protein translocase protein TatB [Fodinicurvata sp. EGI_FJ10296]|uniref:Sec-independent protein translocase protein TatB n=1 Tax=Fodinicurvata sp. EGI_FJ10296 TaxID=3231908 RepID=UPI003453EF4E
MFDIGWPELMIVMIVALIVIGPKDLPKALRQLGKWVGAARRMSSEFHKHVDDIVRETELEDVKRGIDKARSVNIKRELEKQIDPDGSLTQAFNGSKKVSGSGRSWRADESADTGTDTTGSARIPDSRARSAAVTNSSASTGTSTGAFAGGVSAPQKPTGNGITHTTTAQVLTDATSRSPGLSDRSASTSSQPATSPRPSPQKPSVEPDQSVTTDKA